MIKRVLVFKTSVAQYGEIEQLRPVLNRLIKPEEKWNFDLEDCDNILRVESAKLQVSTVQGALVNHGYHCTELED